MKSDETTKSLKQHMNGTNRKMFKEDYLSLRHIDIYSNSFAKILSGEMNRDEFKKEFCGKYRYMNEEEIENMKNSKTIASIINFGFDEDDVPTIEEENVQIVN